MTEAPESTLGYEARPLTLQERLTLGFYEWEWRGRGWQLWQEPVALEPPFRPFLYHLPPPSRPFDDGRKPTFLSSLVDWFRGTGAPPAVDQPVAAPEENEELAECFSAPFPFTELRLSLPAASVVTRESAERFLLALTYCALPVSFEVIGHRDAVTVQLACWEPDRARVFQQLRAHFSEIVVTEAPGALAETFAAGPGHPMVVADFGLSREFMLPLRAARSLDPDPLIAVVGALADLGEGEAGALQVMFQAANAPWAESILRSVTDWEGHAFFADAPQVVALAREKVSRPLCAAVVRVAATSARQDRAWHIARSLGGAVAQFAVPAGNELIPLANDGYEDADHVADFLARRSRRSGMLLNTEELVSLVHPPSGSVRSPRLGREIERSRAVPREVSGGPCILGDNVHEGTVTPVSLGVEQRMRHMHVLGATGTGKSTLLLQMITQDIERGEGVAVLDPHGDLIDAVLGRVPLGRHGDVVLFDPSDEDFPVGLNFLQAHTEAEKNVLASDLVGVFRRLSTSWGDQMTAVLGNAAQAFLESDRPGTLLDLRRFLVDRDFRAAYLTGVRDPEVVYFWEKEFPLLSMRPVGPILTRLDTFLRPKPIRYVVGQRNAKLDFGKVLNSGGILLAKLSHGAIGEENAHLLGSLLVSKLHQVALGRQSIEESERRPFYLYIDEFHHFVTPSLASILTGARKFRLGLILAHQELTQLSESDSRVAHAVLANAGTRVCFRVGEADARKLAEGFASFEPGDLLRLGRGKAIARVERSDWDFNLLTSPLDTTDTDAARAARDRIVALSRANHATRRQEIEAHIAESTGRTGRDVHTKDSQRVPAREPASRPPPEPRRDAQPALSEETVAAPAPPQAKPQPRTVPPAPSPMGHGGPQHRYLQHLLKQWGEELGFRATVEKPILDGRASIDVALEAEGRSIACQVSVTTSPQVEAAHVRDCLEAGFQLVVIVTPEHKHRDRIAAHVRESVSADQAEAIHVLTPDAIHELLSSMRPEGPVEDAGRVRGYKVSLRRMPAESIGPETSKRAITEVVLKALKRLKG